MGGEIAALLGLFGVATGVFAVVATAVAGWMAWRIVEKSGLPGWVGLGVVLLAFTGIGAVVQLILLWVFAFMRWPRDEAATIISSDRAPAAPGALPPPLQALPDGRGWRLEGSTAAGATVSLVIDGSAPAYLLTGATVLQPTDLCVPDASVGQPHARLLTAARRLGLEDLGSRDGTYIDGARLLPEHGPRDISNARMIRLGSVNLALSRA